MPLSRRTRSMIFSECASSRAATLMSRTLTSRVELTTSIAPGSPSSAAMALSTLASMPGLFTMRTRIVKLWLTVGEICPIAQVALEARDVAPTAGTHHLTVPGLPPDRKPDGTRAPEAPG